MVHIFLTGLLRKLKCLISTVQFAPSSVISQVTPVCTQKLTEARRSYLEPQLADWRFCVRDSLESKYFSSLPCSQTMSFESSLFKHNQIVCQNCGDYSQQKNAPVSRHIFVILRRDPYTHWLLQTSLHLLITLGDVRSGSSTLSQWPCKDGLNISVKATHVCHWSGGL